MVEHGITHATTTHPPADAPPRGNTYGTYGCGRPDTAFMRACPLNQGAFLQSNAVSDQCVDGRRPGR